ncbi:MAG TPA: ribosome biogenesis GTPase YlqF [Candidatus Merdivicinus excrementipullorum]|uniref:Ribosome biogenesis GTPase A n=1 Tax=Candidatus Merdivicinus excrementipullorum TaxID=2840867 RepID=A0A9D1K052_9FIRM|nr:ribosome biogenesis GTPase YlqF [Candidatus Merdivicinus excrementipullorum]
MAQTPNIQWFPGHMAKTRRLIQDQVKLVDLVVELTDARIPQSSRNPELNKWIGEKRRLLVLNKSDAADPDLTARWLRYYREQGIPAIAVDARSGKGINQFLPAVREILADITEKRQAKGMVGRPIRMMIVGIPNVGKSSFINRVAKEKRAKVEDRPGVTVDKQWIAVAKDVDLMDTPGVLWPKFEDPAVGEKLAFTGAVKDQILDVELLAMRLLGWLREEYPALLARFKLNPEDLEGREEYELLELVGRRRGMLVSGGEVDTLRAAAMILDEYRGGKLGRLSLEAPPKKEGTA